MLLDVADGGLIGSETVSIFPFLLGGAKKVSRVRFDIVEGKEQ